MPFSTQRCRAQTPVCRFASDSQQEDSQHSDSRLEEAGCWYCKCYHRTHMINTLCADSAHKMHEC